MIILILYTVIILFLDKTAVSTRCLMALKQWYECMIPSLFPMMLCSSILVDTGFAHRLGSLLAHTLLRPLNISDSGSYCLVTGFLCGFPMGAKTTADMHNKGQIDSREASFLLAFINCIGPMYTLQIIHPLFADLALWKLLLGVYALPMAYGLCLRYTLYRHDSFREKTTVSRGSSFLDALYECVPNCGKSILLLGGYMILFQVSFVPFKHFLDSINVITNFCYPLLEITGGFLMLPKDSDLSLILFYTTWGGLCCFLQTYSFLKPGRLSMRKYLIHKSVLALLAYALGQVL